MSDPRVAVTFVVDKLATGGAERHALALANGLDRNRFRVSFIVLKPEGGLESLLERGGLDATDCLDIAGKVDRAAIDRLAVHLDATSAQVILATNPFATLYGVLAARRARRRPAVVSTFHSTVLPGLKNQLQMLFYRFVFPFCDMLVYVCENQRQYWRRRGLRARADTMIYNGIDMAHFALVDRSQEAATVRGSCGFAATDFVVGICAALRPEKAHPDLLGAIAKLAPRLPGVRGLVIGDGPERARLDTAIEAMGLRERVRITGFQMDVRPFVAACDVMVLASHHTETFSLSALESMALGKPMVMTRTGGASEQVEVGQTGFLFAPGDIDALAAHLEAISDSGASRRMGLNAAREVRRRFPLEAMLSQYASLLETVARRPAESPVAAQA